jgi:hypothetical protein
MCGRHTEDQTGGGYDAVVRAQHARPQPGKALQLVALMAVSSHRYIPFAFADYSIS